VKTSLCIHHSAYPLKTTDQWEKIKKLHKSKGWGNSSAYHAFIDQSGQVNEGRSTLYPSAGTQNTLVNWTHIHICFAGNFEIEHPTTEQTN